MFNDESTPNKIIDKLWLGDLLDAQNSKKLRDLGVSHILTLNDWKLDAASSKNFKTLYIQIDDVPDEDIAKHFDKCFTFLDEGLRGGGALVHCLMGMSRSATIIIGYLVARGKYPTFESAFEHVRACRSCIQPNSGFVRQLRSFCDRLGRDKQSPVGTGAADCLASGSQRGVDNGKRESEKSAVRQVYSCKACRARLFNQAALILHRAESGDRVETSESADGVQGEEDEPAEVCSSSLFVDPYAVEWLSKIVLEGSATNGKLHCVNVDCRAKVGSFSWVGEVCAACGAWVTPAFQFHKQKLDSFSFAADSRF